MGCLVMHARRRNVSQHVAMVVAACLLQVREIGAWGAVAAASSSSAAAACQRLFPPTPFTHGGRCHATPTNIGRRLKRQPSSTSQPLLTAVAAEAARISALQEEPEQRRTGNKGAASNNLQSVDFTTALLMSRDLKQSIVPARIENVYQLDAHNVALHLRTLEGNMWLHVCWHPKGARCDVLPDTSTAVTWHHYYRSRL